VHCDGQVLVIHDLLGISGAFKPKFVKQYAQLEAAATRAVKTYLSEVKGKRFPTGKYSFQ